ncbi:MAG TPA: ABC transporter ATP-binding protein [Ktedonobacteraceae bacterium]
MHTFFKDSMQDMKTIRQITQLVWKISPRFFLSLLALALLNGLFPTASTFITAALLGVLVGVIQHGKQASFPADFTWLLVLMAGAVVLGSVVQRLSAVIQNLYQTLVANRINLLIVEKSSEIDLAFFENPVFHNTLRIAVSEAMFRPMMIINQLMNLATTLTTIVTLSIVVILWQAWIIPVLFLSTLVMLRVSVHFGARRVALVKGRSEIDRQKEYLQMLLTSDQAAKEIRLFGLRQFLLGKYRGLLDLTFQQDRKLAMRQIFYTGGLEALLSAVQPLLYSFTAIQVLQGLISIGQFSLYTQAIQQLQTTLTGQMFQLGNLHEGNLFVSNLFEFLAGQPHVEAPRPASSQHRSAISPNPRIEFRDVTFCYPGTEHIVLQDLSFIIQPGESVALVGANGAGKSTFVKLLSGLYEPTSGQILLDDVSIQDLDRQDLRRFLSVIFQDYTIYHFSAYDNIGLGQVAQIQDRASLEVTARRSGLDRIIQQLPNGYETILGRHWESGHELSGGQRQLVALSRALIRNAPILVLDEPSAALDIYAERDFFQHLLADRAEGETQSVIFISHRFASVCHADRIFVLEHGHLSEQGTHHELLAQKGRYAEMFNLQAEPYNGQALALSAQKE